MERRLSVQAAFDLQGRVAIVTGGAGLLGREFSRALAESGARVAIADLDNEAAVQVAGELQHMGHETLGVGTDVTARGAINKLMEDVAEQLGSVNILVNCAALDPKFDLEHQHENIDSFEDMPLEVWNNALAVNLTGVFLCSQAAARFMVERENGVIINLCSTYGLVGPDQRIYEQPGQPKRYKPVHYSVTKAGVLGLTRYLATYYAGKGIRVNALTPGGVFSGHDEEFVRQYSARTILGRMARPDELNAALLFLASDASSYMTGANLVVDGGWTAW